MYNQKTKEATMKYLATLKEIRFRVKPEEYERYVAAAKDRAAKDQGKDQGKDRGKTRSGA